MLDEYLDKVLQVVRFWSEDFKEISFYIGKYWIEVWDDEKFYSVVMYIFNEDGEYIRVVDGDFSFGEWRYFGNKFVFEDEVFELVFMDLEFFIFIKYGNFRKFGCKYYVYVVECFVKRFIWWELVELLFNKY